MIIADRGRHTAIVISQGPKYITCVQLDSGELHISRLTTDEYNAEGFHAIDYPLTKAIASYLAHQGGVSAAASRALKGLQLNDLLN